MVWIAAIDQSDMVGVHRYAGNPHNTGSRRSLLLGPSTSAMAKGHGPLRDEEVALYDARRSEIVCPRRDVTASRDTFMSQHQKQH